MKSVARSLGFISLVVLCGCASHRPATEPGGSTPREQLTRYRDNRLALRDFRGWGLISVSTPEGKAVYGLDLVYLAPRRLRAVLKGTLGVEAGRLILNEGRFLVVSGSDVYRGNNLNASPLVDVVGFQVSAADVWESLLPISPGCLPEDAVYEGIDPQSGFLLFTDSSEGLNCLYGLDRDLPVIRFLRRFDDSGNLLAEKTVSDVKLFDDLWLPTKWTLCIFRGDDRYVLDVSLSSVKVNRGVNEDIFQIPLP